MKILALGTLVASLGFAPFQCHHEPDPNARREDTAGEALFALAQEFESKGDRAAAAATLRYLVQHYPANRHSPAARIELDALGDAAPP